MTPSVSPETAIRDLQNARQVLAQNGYTQRSFVDPRQGSVCLDGALRLATTSKLVWLTSGRLAWTYRPVCGTFPDGDDPNLLARHEAAVAALIRVLPQECSIPHQCALRLSNRDAPDWTDAEFVWHFNDHVCRGGAEADTVLEQAIEKLQADL